MDKKSQHTLEFDKVLNRLAQFTSFSAGESLARQLTPTADLEEARRWQAETSEARILHDSRSDLTLGGARDVRRVADNAMRGFILQPDALLEVRNTIAAARDLRRKLLKLEDHSPNLANIAELIEECPGLVSAISEALDERGDVLDSASPELAKVRRDLRIVHDRIQEKLRRTPQSQPQRPD
jgi:DNA mismatch repair protein MutS2